MNIPAVGPDQADIIVIDLLEIIHTGIIIKSHWVDIEGEMLWLGNSKATDVGGSIPSKLSPHSGTSFQGLNRRRAPMSVLE